MSETSEAMPLTLCRTFKLGLVIKILLLCMKACCFPILEDMRLEVYGRNRIKELYQAFTFTLNKFINCFLFFYRRVSNYYTIARYVFSNYCPTAYLNIILNINISYDANITANIYIISNHG